MACAADASRLLTVAPNSGGRCSSATSIPGNAKSIVNCAVPFDFATASTRGIVWSISLNCAGSFKTTVSGTGSVAAVATKAPKVACRPAGP
jgi:hypothetical protein